MSNFMTRTRDFKILEIVFIFLTLLFCLLVALNLPVNCFPEDGWFETQYRLIGKFTGWDNYTPIAAPAIFYAVIHLFAIVLGLDLTGEFYLGSIIQNLLLFSSGIFIYLSSKILKCKHIGLFFSFVTVVCISSTYLTQSFWSENITLFLTSASLYIICRVYADVKITSKTFLILSIVLGVLLGLHITTRVISIITLPAIFVLFWFRLENPKRVLLPVIITLVVLAIITMSMTANYYRFGRFELSNSTGRHLWQGISKNSDVMLKGSTNYQVLKHHIPDIQGKNWWEINIENIPHFKNISKESLLKKLSIEAILNMPCLYINMGIEKLRTNITKFPFQLGLHRGYHNYFQRDEFLPPLISLLPPQDFKDFLNRMYSISVKLYSVMIVISIYIVSTTIMVTIIKLWTNYIFSVNLNFRNRFVYWSIGFLFLAISEGILIIIGWFLKVPKTEVILYTALLIGFYSGLLKSGSIGMRFLKKSFKNAAYYVPITSLLLYLFIASLYLNFQIEVGISRYAIPYIPIFVLMASLSIKTLLILLEPESSRNHLKRSANTRNNIRLLVITVSILLIGLALFLRFGLNKYSTYSEREGKWWLRVDGGSVASLVFPPENPEMVRIAIKEFKTKNPWDIQLNQPRLSVKANHRYAVIFRARADSPRTINLGFAKAHDPWDGLGLYQELELTPEWQGFEMNFVATADDDNARILFDLGTSDISVELSDATLYSLSDGQSIEPNLP